MINMASQSEPASTSSSRDRPETILDVEHSRTEEAHHKQDRLKGSDENLPVKSASNFANRKSSTATKLPDGPFGGAKRDQQAPGVSRFLSVNLQGSIEVGSFDSVNDVYMKYSVVTGPDWILSSGSDVGITQISRYKKDENGTRIFVWNQPISISYRSYNYFGWPQIVLSVYYFDLFGNDQLLGYGCTHLPISSSSPPGSKQLVKIYAPQSSSMIKQLLSWIVGRKPELVNSNLVARADCRSVLQMVHVGHIELSFDLTSKDVASNGYRS